MTFDLIELESWFKYKKYSGKLNLKNRNVFFQLGRGSLFIFAEPIHLLLLQGFIHFLQSHGRFHAATKRFSFQYWLSWVLEKADETLLLWPLKVCLVCLSILVFVVRSAALQAVKLLALSLSPPLWPSDTHRKAFSVNHRFRWQQ